MSDQSKLGIGKIIESEQGRDAIHVAVAPVEAGEMLWPGTKVFLKDGKAYPESLHTPDSIGIVDPFLTIRVAQGQKFWIFLYPGSITSLAHHWTHPAFSEENRSESNPPPEQSASEKWMRRWAVRHMGQDYYGDGGERSEDDAYASALEAGRKNHIGPYEDAREHIDNTWWDHWENITGEKGDRDDYFSCAC